MPNWVYSSMTIWGKQEDLQKFKEMYSEKLNDGTTKIISNNKVFEYPRHFKLLDKNSDKESILTEQEKKELILIGLEGYDLNQDGYNQGGYDWFLSAFGTKWGFCNVSISQETNKKIVYNFETAWSMIANAIIKMSKDNPNVRIKYSVDEESGSFKGNIWFKNGEILKENITT